MKPSKRKAFDFIKRVLASCKTLKHCRTASKLIDNFYNMFHDCDMSIQLRTKLIEILERELKI